MQDCYRLLSDQMDDNPLLQTKDTAPWEELPYECRIDWTSDGFYVVKQNALAYISSQPDDGTYYTDG